MSTSTKPRPVRIAGALLAAVSVVAGGLTGIAGLEDNAAIATYAGLALLVSGALTATLIPVLEGKVVPVSDVVTYVDADRQVVAGPAKTAEWESYGFEPGRHTDADGDGIADAPQT